MVQEEQYIPRKEYEQRHQEVILKLDKTVEKIDAERLEMAEERGQLKIAKILIPMLTSALGFLMGTLVTLIVYGIRL